jgi:hypothetical protein
MNRDRKERTKESFSFMCDLMSDNYPVTTWRQLQRLAGVRRAIKDAPCETVCGAPGTNVASWSQSLTRRKTAPGEAAPAPEPSIVMVCGALPCRWTLSSLRLMRPLALVMTLWLR